MYRDDDGNNYDIENLIDALDHIMRVSRQSHSMTKRLKFLELRAKSALEGTDEWRDYDYPRNRARAEESVRKRLRATETQLAYLRRCAEAAMNGWKVGDDIAEPMRRLHVLLEGDGDD